MAECKTCGYQLSDKDTVCPMCGAAVEKAPVQQPVNRRRCLMCGKETDASAQFCPSCGKQMAQPAAAPAAKPAAAEQKSGWVYLLGAFGLFFLLWLITNNI